MIDDHEFPISPLEAAEDYRRQRQSAEAKSSVLKWVTRDDMIKFAGSRQMIARMMQYGMSAEEASVRLLSQATAMAAVPVGTEYDTPEGQFILGWLIDDIKSACEANGISIGDGVVFGVSLETTVEAGVRPVLGTQASIISVTRPFIGFCSVASKLLTLTMAAQKSPLLEERRINIQFGRSAIRRHLVSNPNLIKYWMLFIDSYARRLAHPEGMPLFDLGGHLAGC